MPPTEAHRQLLDAFRSRRMGQHADLLATGRMPAGLVEEWLRLLRVPPYERAYQVLPRGAPCPGCGGTKNNLVAPGSHVGIVFPNGWSERCAACRTTWLHLDAA